MESLHTNPCRFHFGFSLGLRTLGPTVFLEWAACGCGWMDLLAATMVDRPPPRCYTRKRWGFHQLIVMNGSLAHHVRFVRMDVGVAPTTEIGNHVCDVR